MKNRRGITLIELLVVIAVVGILAIALSVQFTGWRSGYIIETQMKQMHANLMNARARAMQMTRSQFVTLATTLYSHYDDTYNAVTPLSPDGDRILQGASDTRVLQKSLDTRYPITWSVMDPPTIAFTKTGIARDVLKADNSISETSSDKTICDNHPFQSLPQPDPAPDYDCIIIAATRISLGKLTNHIHDGGACDAANCVAR